MINPLNNQPNNQLNNQLKFINKYKIDISEEGAPIAPLSPLDGFHVLYKRADSSNQAKENKSNTKELIENDDLEKAGLKSTSNTISGLKSSMTLMKNDVRKQASTAGINSDKNLWDPQKQKEFNDPNPNKRIKPDDTLYNNGKQETLNKIPEIVKLLNEQVNTTQLLNNYQKTIDAKLDNNRARQRMNNKITSDIGAGTGLTPGQKTEGMKLPIKELNANTRATAAQNHQRALDMKERREQEEAEQAQELNK